MSYRITEACNGCGACGKVCPVEAISGRKNSLHAVNDEQCIECGVCGRVCPIGAVQDPFGIRCTMLKKSSWEKPLLNKKQCMSCGICIDACPVGCLAMASSDSAYPHEYPGLENEKTCIGCGFCARECPVDAISMKINTQISIRQTKDI